MATITTSIVVESIVRGDNKRNLYRYTLDNGEVHERRGWVSLPVDNTTDMNARGALLLIELAEAEFEQIVGAV